MNWINELYLKRSYDLGETCRDLCLGRSWKELEQYLNHWAEKKFYPWLREVKEFQKIESMLSLGEGSDPDEDEGIWHDDGSRVLAFSLSLNFYGPIDGGSLWLKKKNEAETKALKLGPYAPGEMIVFKTGIDGAEHRVQKVSHGSRLVFVGWCS